MLISGSIKELILDHCCIDDDRGVGTTIAAGLMKNQSLRSFTYWDLNGCEALMAAVPIMAAWNRNLETLGVELSTARYGSNALLKAIEAGKSLKSLRLRSYRAGIQRSDIQRILQTCAATDTLQELDFCEGTTFDDESSFQFLLEQLSERAIVNALVLPTLISFSDGRYCPRCPKIKSLLSTLKVRTLFIGQALLPSTSLIDEIARTGYIQHLGIQCHYVEDFGGELSNWLRESPLPIELILVDGCPTLNSIQSIAKYDKSTTGLKCITCQSTTYLNLVRVSRQLTDVQGLRKLRVLCDNSGIPEVVFATLAQCLEQNRFLNTVSLHAELSQVMTNPIVKNVERIRCALAINRVGHFRLMVHPNPVPASLWARVLARSFSDPEGIFFVLREKPDIVVIGIHQQWGPQRRLGRSDR